MALTLLIIGLAFIIATIIFLFVVHFNRFEKFTDIFQYWLDPRYRLLYDAYVYYKKSQKDAAEPTYNFFRKNYIASLAENKTEQAAKNIVCEMLEKQDFIEESFKPERFGFKTHYVPMYSFFKSKGWESNRHILIETCMRVAPKEITGALNGIEYLIRLIDKGWCHPETLEWINESKQLQALAAKRIGVLLGIKSYASVFSKLWNCQKKFLSDNAYSAMGSSNFASLDNQLREVFPEYKEKEE
jgi:hypothetical protein